MSTSLIRFFLVFMLFCNVVEPTLANLTDKSWGHPPLVRREWRRLSKSQQKDYLRAVKCLIGKPSKTSNNRVPGVKNRYDDFTHVHIESFFQIHFVGQFLPWHRYFLWTYETALREECNYSGAQPYWDWTLDVPPHGNFSKSPLWDPEFGFGGNGLPVKFVQIPDGPGPVPGATGGGCVQDGPFKNLTINLGPMSDVSGNARCLTRDFSPAYAAEWVSEKQTKLVLQQPTYGNFIRVLEREPVVPPTGIHGGGHTAAGGNYGVMADPFASPNDPLFYLHHANLDRVWWTWQSKQLPKRLREISGPLVFNDYTNSVAGNTTLDYTFNLGVNAPEIPISQIMDIRGGGILHYSYDRLYKC